MQPLNRVLFSTTLLPTVIGGGVIALSSIAFASTNDTNQSATPKVNPAVISRTVTQGDGTLVANACNPCTAKKNPCATANPCNPCAAVNPCAAQNPCNPCGVAKPTNHVQRCAVPRLASSNPCNPRAAKNPCNPCAAVDAPELSAAEALAAYNCIKETLVKGYAKANLSEIGGYTDWLNVATSPYNAATHGGRYVTNWVNKAAETQYQKYEEIGAMPVGSVIAKDSFQVSSDGKVSPGPMFIMEKMKAGFDTDSGDWRYSMVMPNGSLFGQTNGKNSSGMVFCKECHAAVAEDQDYLMLLPEEVRK